MRNAVPPERESPRLSDFCLSTAPPLHHSITPSTQPLTMSRDLVTVQRFYTEHATSLQLHLVAGATGLKRLIREPTVNRPGLVLSGFTRYFAFKRVQTIGNAEAHFLKSLAPPERPKRYATFFSYKIPCVVFSRNLQPDKLFLKAAEE